MSQRKRATGFALMDTAFAADSKFVRLARIAKSPADYAAAVGVFWLLLAEARRVKSPTVDWDDFEDYTAQIGLLQKAGLLTADGFEVVAFDRWAPAYRSPSERVPEGTQGYGEVPEVPASTDPSGQLASTHISSDHVASLHADDSVTIACRMFMDGGRWLGDKEYVAAWDDMDHRYSPEWVQSEIAPAYAAVYALAGKVRPWDFKRMVELRCAERTRAEERDRVQRRMDADAAETEQLRRRAEEATDEERERASIVRRAIGLWMRKRPTEPVPTDFDELATWLERETA